MPQELGVALDARGNVQVDTDATRQPGSGCSLPHMARGQSLVVWAIREGRQCARAIDEFLMGASELPR
jgi:glutamate synthase (NADPH/NADH) small chain